MKIYAQLMQCQCFKYRLNTLLQFGDSWDLIGNIVLANPGSAKPQKAISNEDWQSVEKFLKKYRPNKQNGFTQDSWCEFVPDSTMRQIEKLFSGYYTHANTKELSGVIQLFNCFNVINQNLDEAIKNLDKYDKNLCFYSSIWNYFYDKPVYFGFTKSVLEVPKLRSIAEDIFKNTPQNLKQIYEQDFSKNKFYHLGYINRAYKRIAYINDILKPFVESVVF